MKFSERLALAASTASLAAAPAIANAAAVTNYNSVSISNFDHAPGGDGDPLYVGWDIDGVNGPDMFLFAFGAKTTNELEAFGLLGMARPATTASSTVFVQVRRSEGASNFAANNLAIGSSFRFSSYGGGSYALRPRIGFYDAGAGIFQPYAGSIIELFASGGGTRASTAGPVTASTGANFGALPFGSSNIAFALARPDGFHVGWARVTLLPTSFTINHWTYNSDPFAVSDPETDIHVGTVPEPTSALPAIALLAAGAVGVRSWRKRKAAA